ncbi:MmcQ/YjbR family DNA-binding protein [Flaviaesturariibacter amylovorans]|uniref:MmcQ/YjbR family DNA-binding protein n=1 Tax=Flaviaesturariibacter amylovorans TaxID=1084520 RepID=A0ABP8HFU5_9BACT
MTPDDFRRMALALPGSTEEPHQEKTSFRVHGKIYATMVPEAGRVTIKLPREEQDIFCLHDPAAMFPVPNAWGRQGWTHALLDRVHPELLSGALECAHAAITPPAKKRKG